LLLDCAHRVPGNDRRPLSVLSGSLGMNRFPATFILYWFRNVTFCVMTLSLLKKLSVPSITADACPGLPG
jgi:hypothetical protein